MAGALRCAVHQAVSEARAAQGRIRPDGLFANGNRSANIAWACELLAMPLRVTESETNA